MVNIKKGQIWYSNIMEYKIIIQQVTKDCVIYRVYDEDQPRGLLVDFIEDFLNKFKQ